MSGSGMSGTAGDHAGGLERLEARVLFNSVPYAEQDEFVVLQDGPAVLLDVLANDTDADGDPLDINVFDGPRFGSAQVVDNQVLYTPLPGFSGQDDFVYGVRDFTNEFDTATVIVQVQPSLTNQRPYADQDLFDVINIDGAPVDVDVLANDTDADSDPLSVSAITFDPSFGTAEIVGNLVRYTPNAGFSGQDFFNYQIDDGNGGTDSATAILIVAIGAGANTNPFAGQDELNVSNTGQPIMLDVLANDTDADGDPLSISGITFAATFGTATVVGNRVEYTPNPGFFGQDHFAYGISDGRGGTDSATTILQVSLTPNTDPDAVDDTANVDQDAGATDIDVLANDSDAEDDPLTITDVTQGTNGAVTIGAGVVTYTPNPGYSGPDSFTYTIGDGNGGTDTATVNVTVVPTPNSDPDAVDDTANVDQDAGATDIDVLANDTDAEDDPLTITAVTQGTNGAVAIGAGVVTYTPNPGYSGPDSFTYTVDDGNGGTDTATVDVTVVPTPNTDPDAVDDTATLEQDSGTASIDVLANDTDAEDDPLTIASVTQGANGSVAIGSGVVLYTPSAGYSGPDSFTYTLDDGNGGTDTAAVDVTVTPVNRGSIGLGAGDYVVNEDAGTLTFSVIRTDGADGEVSATYTTVDDTATDGSDYTGVSGTAVFADGQTEVLIDVPITDDPDAEGDETFSLSLNAVNGGAALGTPRTALVTILDDDTVEIGDGLNADYFDSNDLTNLVLERIDPVVDFDWQSGSPDSSIDDNFFSARWTGTLEVPETGTYIFRTRSDDGVRLWVDRQLLIDNWTLHAPVFDSGVIALTANTRVDIQMDYFEQQGTAVAELYWTVPGGTEEIIPTDALFSDDITPINIAGLPELQGETIVTGLNQPTALDFGPDGTMYIAQKNGIVRVAQNGTLLPAPFVDFSAPTNNVRDRGMLGIAVHPDFTNHPYVYVLYTYDPPETQGQSGLAAPDQRGNRPARLSRFTADAATGYTTAVPGSEVVILGTNSTWENITRPDLDSTNDFSLPPSGYDENGDPIRDYIASDSQSHTIGSLDFGADGSLYVSVGDGTSYGAVDPRTVRVQDVDSLSGKILRIDPLTGDGYADNPYATADLGENRSKVYAFGLRNPFRIAVQPGTDDVFIGDVGWNSWEEINRATGAGENFGWPFYEGGLNGNSKTGGYRDLPEADDFYDDNNAQPPLFAFSHQNGSNSIALGDFYTGSLYGGYTDALFFTNFNQPTISAAFLNPDGSLQSVVQAAQPVGGVVEMSMGLDGYLYYVDLFGGVIGRFYDPSGTGGSGQSAQQSAGSFDPGASGELFGRIANTPAARTR